MLQMIKKNLPKPVIKLLISIKQKTYYQRQKKILFKSMQLKHTTLLKRIKGKDKIKVVFLAIHKSMWKVDPVFQKMLIDPLFEPEILVCPYMDYGEERMLEDLEQTYHHFIEKGYPVRKSLKEDGSWLMLDEIKPDIVFFTNPHDLTHKEYYENAYLNYLSCYVPYSQGVSRYDNYNAQYNQRFHNAMWRIFLPHNESLEIFISKSASKGKNALVTGYPSCEEFFNLKKESPWKHNNKLKVIWAPHHTINDPWLPYANFLGLADNFKELSKKYSRDVSFSFKPHPILKSKLYQHPQWGKEKTDTYYDFWKNSSNTQLDEGEYIELFKHSDAMIHDSGSFLAEYHCVKKPVFYICTEEVKAYLNPFGIKAMNSTYQGKSIDDIDFFISELINKNIKPNNSFFNQEIKKYFVVSNPSSKIINNIRDLVL